MVLLDDNFATIVAAVREGRRIYDNIRKFIKYTMTSNTGEILVLLLAPFVGLPVPLQPIHILWVNLVTDGLPGLAFSGEPAERDIMRRPPRPPAESVFSRGLWQHMLWVGFLIAGLSLATAAGGVETLAYWQTMVFTTLVVAQLFNALAVRSESGSLLSIGPFSNRFLVFSIAAAVAGQLAVVYVPQLNPVFETVPLSWRDLLLCFGLGAVVLPVVEAEKRLRRGEEKRGQKEKRGQSPFFGPVFSQPLMQIMGSTRATIRDRPASCAACTTADTSL
jgi:Ca2+-transporting ATPase